MDGMGWAHLVAFFEQGVCWNSCNDIPQWFGCPMTKMLAGGWQRRADFLVSTMSTKTII